MTFKELNACYEHRWPSKLTDLEGEAGYMVYKSLVYYWTYFYGEEEPKIERVYAVKEFLLKYSDTTDWWILQVVQELRNYELQ